MKLTTAKAKLSTLMCGLSLLIVGCGGGGGSSESAPAAAQPPVVVTDATPDPLPDPQQEPVVIEATSDLVADSTFDLATHKNVSVNIDISGTNNSQGYLSICSAKADGAPDYEDCYLRTALPDGTHQSTLLVGTNVLEVVSAIWFLDLSAEPVITRHDLAASQLTLSI